MTRRAKKPPIYVYEVTEVDVDSRSLPPDAWVTLVDAGRFLGIGRGRVRRLAGNGKLESLKLGAAPGRNNFRFLVSTDSLNQRKAERGAIK
jgi:hypothetical protein